MKFSDLKINKNPFQIAITCDSLDFMDTMPENSVDVIVTSPPYNIGVRYNNYNDNKNYEDYLKWCKLFGDKIHRILHEKGSFFSQHRIFFSQSVAIH